MSFFTSGIVPSGVVLPYAGSTAPQGWLLCYGQEVSRTTYSGLFAAIGTTYGNGNGSTTFNLPDCRGRAMFGKDNMGGVAANRVTVGISGITGTTLGATGGSESMHQHNHSATGLTNSSSPVSGTAALTGSGTLTGHSHSASDSGHTHYFYDNTAGFGPVRTNGQGTNAVTNHVTSTGYANITVGASNIDHTHSVSGTATAQTISGSVANQGAGSSQNMVPTIIMNTIIKV